MSEALTIPVPFDVLAAAFSSDGTKIVLLDQQGWVRIIPWKDRWYLDEMKKRRVAERRLLRFLSDKERADYFRTPFVNNQIFGLCQPILEWLHVVPALPREISGEPSQGGSSEVKSN